MLLFGSHESVMTRNGKKNTIKSQTEYTIWVITETNVTAPNTKYFVRYLDLLRSFRSALPKNVDLT